MKRTIVVTGGAGYIGSHTAYLLAKKGYHVIIIDTFVYDQPNSFPWATVIKGDCADKALLERIFTTYAVEAVMHCAALIDVRSSVERPFVYYEHNVVKTMQLLEVMLAHSVTRFIFSSSCAVYGVPNCVPLQEDHAKNPISPYGTTKLIVEQMLQDLAETQQLEFVALRYFNAAGALFEHNLGEYHVPETHLIPRALQAAISGDPFYIFGTTYNTDDGTCVRDFLHVMDIAQAHCDALDYLGMQGPSTAFNLGTGVGTSVMQLVGLVNDSVGKSIQCISTKERQGDPAVLVADASRAYDILGWKPRFTLQEIVASAYAFMQVKKRVMGVAKDIQSTVL